MCYPMRCSFLLVLLVLLSDVTSAQSVYGTIQGVLMLGSGAPASKALVQASSLDQGALQIFSAQTDDSGYFILSNLPLGNYQVRMQTDGYKTHEEPLINVAADTPIQINVRLIQGDRTVTEVGDGSAVSILKLDRADVATSFSLHEIESLPIFMQNVSRYEFLVPGAVRVRNALPTQQNPQNGVYASVNGQHFSGTTVLVDGTVNRDPLEGIVVLNPSLDSVSELKVTTQNYGAEFGPATGGVVSIQTRSGTNSLHGSAFGYRLSGFGQASTPNFDNTSVLQSHSAKRNEFGVSLGGAAIRDRLFLFGDYRGVRSSDDGTVLVTVPTSKVHETCTGALDDTNCDLTEYYEKGGVVFNDSKDPTSCEHKLFSTGMIPNGCVSPQMVAFLKKFPPPNVKDAGLTNHFTGSGSNLFSNDNFDIRADYVVSSKLRMFTRYSFADFRENGSPAFSQAAGGLGTNQSKFAGTLNDRNQGIAAGFSKTINHSLLTDFRFGFFRFNLSLDSLDAGTTPATDAKINGLNLPNDSFSTGMPDIQLDNPELSGLPIAGDIDFMRLGYSTAVNTCACPLHEREQQFQFVDNWTKLVGKHNIRWGGDFRYLQNFRLSSNDSRGAGHLEFQNATGGGTGFSLSDFLTGTVASFDRAYVNPANPEALTAGERQKRAFFYGEDTWRVNSRLTVNYGLRWEIYFPQSATGANAGGWLQLGSGGLPVEDTFRVAGQAGTNLHGGVQTTLKNFGPRFGVAYLLNPTTVVRAGYGRMFDPGYAGTIFGIAITQSPPVSLITTVQNGFTINSNVDPAAANPIDICTLGGICTVPPFVFRDAPFTIHNLYTDNTIMHDPNSPLPDQVQSANLYALPHRLRLPTVDAWNVAVQEAFGRHTYFEIAYVANKGTHVLNDSFGLAQVPYYDLNQPTLEGFIQKIDPDSGFANCQGGKNQNQGNAYCKTQQTIRQAFNPWTSQVRYFGSNASSNYHSLQVKVRHQFSSGFSLLAHYTWSKVIDFDNLYYAIDPSVTRGVGNFDRKHNFVMTNVWNLPLGRGKKLLGDTGPALDRVIGGWSLAAITSWSSGLPFTPTYSGCGADVGATPFKVCRPNLVGSVHTTGDRRQYFTTTNGTPLLANCITKDADGNNKIDLCPQGTKQSQQGFNPTGTIVDGVAAGDPLVGQTIGPWQRPGAGQIGDAGRNSLRGPGFFQSDLAVGKDISVTEGIVVRFRADAFNIFNKVNLTNPNTNVDGPAGTAGAITALAQGAVQREFQFSLRISF